MDDTLASYTEDIKCVSLNNRPCQVTQTLVDINSNETIFYPFNVNFDKCGGSCNTIGYPYAPVCVPNKVKNMNVKIFNLMSNKSNKTFSLA